MSLLREIQTAAIESETDLATLLRKCKVLAARLGNAEFGTWVDNELNGYKPDDDLPQYRILGVRSKGHFLGSFRELSNADIPLMNIPEKFRESVSHAYINLPVASIAKLIEDSDGRSAAQEPWLPDLVALVSTQIYQNMNCMQAWKVIPIPNLIAILDEIRNRVLSFVLEIEAEDPEAGEAEINSNSVPQEKIQQFFHTHIAGDIQNVSIGSHNFKQQTTNTNANAELFSQLIDTLQSIKDSELRENLISSVEEMRSTQGTERFKDEYKKFMSLLADHLQVLSPIVTPYLPALAEILS